MALTAEQRKEYQREWVRQKRGSVSTKSTELSTDVTKSVDTKKVEYPALTYWLSDQNKRVKLQKIINALKVHTSKENAYLEMVTFGTEGPNFQQVEEYLNATATGR